MACRSGQSASGNLTRGDVSADRREPFDRTATTDQERTMPKPTHTPEPWNVHAMTIRGDGLAVADCFHHLPDTINPVGLAMVAECNAERIVACVNACAGINPAAVPALLDMLCRALPYVEEAERDKAYKPGAVAQVTKAIRDAIALAEG